MLVYFFWHRPAPAVDVVRYAAALAAFHDALSTEPPRGFVASGTARVDRLPWEADARAAHEDWYAVDDGAALDALDGAAIDGRRRGAHDTAAGLARDGWGGLYTLRTGDVAALSSTQARWFGKPAGTTYAALAVALPGTGTALLQRKMVLGPAPEFCVRGEGPITLPAGCTAVDVGTTT